MLVFLNGDIMSPYKLINILVKVKKKKVRNFKVSTKYLPSVVWISLPSHNIYLLRFTLSAI